MPWKSTCSLFIKARRNHVSELTINPLGRGTHLSKDLAEIVKIVEASGLAFCLTPFGTCIEGDWDQVMDVVKRCRACAKSFSHHVMTSIQIEDEDRAANKLEENVAAIERIAGHPLTRLAHKVVEAEA
ncbi:MAG TPA: MTH1187 family thiamine-binding protein [Bryobacteraceae bacterium]|nr:MTH1187 family thiamine-binding protein [Bryobacteraceae bacterium]